MEAKKGKKKIKLNGFGCVSVGSFCKNDGQCCSGICQGKKPKKGKKVKSVCVAHNTGGCPIGENACLETEVPCGEGGGVCFETTGKASFCGVRTSAQCRVCRKDTDCEGLGFGAGAACLACAFCEATAGTACAAA